MTTPFTSISVPVLGAFSVLAIRFLERNARQAEPSTKAPAGVQESSEEPALAICARIALSCLHQRRHPGGVVELSDVRGDQRRHHAAATVPERAASATSKNPAPRRCLSTDVASKGSGSPWCAGSARAR